MGVYVCFGCVLVLCVHTRVFCLVCIHAGTCVCVSVHVCVFTSWHAAHVYMGVCEHMGACVCMSSCVCMLVSVSALSSGCFQCSLSVEGRSWALPVAVPRGLWNRGEKSEALGRGCWV